jgi:hypothetical protein
MSSRCERMRASGLLQRDVRRLVDFEATPVSGTPAPTAARVSRARVIGRFVIVLSRRLASEFRDHSDSSLVGARDALTDAALWLCRGPVTRRVMITLSRVEHTRTTGSICSANCRLARGAGQRRRPRIPRLGRLPGAPVDDRIREGRASYPRPRAASAFFGGLSARRSRRPGRPSTCQGLSPVARRPTSLSDDARTLQRDL